MAAQGHRVERLAEEIRNEVAEIVAGELQDPRIGLATVTRVELAPGLRHARILVTVLGDDAARQETLEGLSSAARFVGRELGRRLRLRRIPEVVFIFDRGADAEEKVEALLQKLKGQA